MSSRWEPGRCVACVGRRDVWPVGREWDTDPEKYPVLQVGFLGRRRWVEISKQGRAWRGCALEASSSDRERGRGAGGAEEQLAMVWSQ